ncbi:unnamed protein product [Dibothriocephalus latus]|uniref:Uncharacterized protein n=1 Tax=Dibothriocephalus latus TaxID=60516 RepID=A0A3P7QIG2_DIBLA|nr:unnamed protein product [Dibothriocephalus latus]
MGAVESRLLRKHKTVSAAPKHCFHSLTPFNHSPSLASPAHTDLTAIIPAQASLTDNHLLTVTEPETHLSSLSGGNVLSTYGIHSENDDIRLKDTIPTGGHQLLCYQPQHTDWFSKESETLRENLHNLGLLGDATDSYSEGTKALNGGEIDKDNMENSGVGAVREEEEDEEELSSISSLLNLEAAINTGQAATATGDLKPQHSSGLGFRTLPGGDVVFTAYLSVPGQNEFTWSRLRQRSERNMKGLRQQFNCDIKLYDKLARHRALPVHKLRIRGTSYRDVMRCKNALPNYIANSLITSKQHCDDVMSYEFHKR